MNEFQSDVMYAGIEVRLMGLRAARDLIDAQIKTYEALLHNARLLANGDTPVPVKKRRGRPLVIPGLTNGEQKQAAELEAVTATVTPVAVNGKPKRRKRKYKAGLPAMIDGKYTVQQLAKELGYKGTWGLTLYLRGMGIMPVAVSPGNGLRRAIVITEAQRDKLMKARAAENTRVRGASA